MTLMLKLCFSSDLIVFSAFMLVPLVSKMSDIPSAAAKRHDIEVSGA